MKKRYENLRSIIKRFYDSNLTKEEIINDEITNDNIREAIRLYNKMDVLSTNGKGVNTLKSNLFNRDLFKSKNYNSSFLASLAYSEDEESKNIVNYIFKQVPDNLLFMFNNNYSENFNDSIIPLLDSEKYIFFASLISKNTDLHKIICRTYDTSKNLDEEIVPLRLFIYIDSWYICGYNIKKKEITIINSINISRAQELKEICTSFISNNQIDKFIENFIKNSNQEEFFFLKLKPEIFNLLINQKLANSDFLVYEEKTEMNNKNFVNDSTNSFLNSKIQLCKVDTLIAEEYVSNSKMLFFPKRNSKKYIFKIKTSCIKYILNKFPDIEVININKYNII